LMRLIKIRIPPGLYGPQTLACVGYHFT